MTGYLERDYRNGHAVVRVERSYVEFVFVDNHGDVCELHCALSESTYQVQLDAFLNAGDEDDEFHPSQLSGWEPGRGAHPHPISGRVVTGAGATGYTEPNPLADAIREAMAILRRQAEGVVTELRELEDIAAHLDDHEIEHDDRVVGVVRRNSVDCGIKLG